VLVHGTRRRAAIAVAAVIAVVGSVLLAGTAGATVKTQVRGFDGTTIKVGSLGYKATLATSQIGAEARIKRFNDDNEIKGVKLQYTGFEDDNSDPATALSSARKLVTQDQVFAIVGDTSTYNPKDFLAQQKVPYFGWGFETSYCSPKTPSTSLWGFGYNGCQVNTQPQRVVDFAGKVYEWVSAKLSKQHPTVALINYDSDASRSTMTQNVIAYKGSGFDVVAAKSVLPAPPSVISDYTPYVQQLLTSNGGKAPDVIDCLVATECIQIYSLLQGQGYSGIFQHALYTDILVKPFAGSIVTASNANYNSTGIASLDQMKQDVDAVKPGQKLDNIILSGYASTDMFIQALKTAAKKGKSNITPDAVQKIAARQTWQMKGFTGPVVYPTATNRQSPYCTALFQSDGTQWSTIEDYGCSTKTFPFKK
jgi:ABC-type branched-subunit amino acid transport system substrate-binding protein